MFSIVLTLNISKMKKTYLILNGDHMMFIQKENQDQALAAADGICDHTKEVIVREVDFSKITDTINNWAMTEVTDYVVMEYMNKTISTV